MFSLVGLSTEDLHTWALGHLNYTAFLEFGTIYMKQQHCLVLSYTISSHHLNFDEIRITIITISF